MDIIVLGSGAFAREAYDWIQQSGHKVVGFFSGRDNPATELRGLPIYYDPKLLPRSAGWIVGSGNTKAMREMVSKVDKFISPACAIVHPSCVTGSNVKVGRGSVVCPGSILTCDITIGESVLINIGCTIGHDVEIGDYVHLSPNTSLSGGVKIGTNCEVGTGVSVIPQVKVGNDILVGAGAAITKDLDAPGIYVGVPAKMRSK
ncbi:acetyltransferase [Bdellovibrio bacteriovorus]|uniref:acetyltransferase n=1 Tax=Bdellovibrio bacteriovorus TaxID=959 RepID=UPI003A804515